MIPSLVVFDIAGTVIDKGSMAPILAFQDTFAECGIRLIQDIIRLSGLGKGKREHLRELCSLHNISRNSKQFEDMWNRLLDHLDRRVAERNEWIPGAAGAVRHISHWSHIAFNTGYMERQMRILFPSLPSDAFSICRSDVESGRPSTLMIEACMRHYGVTDPSTVIVVGDTPVDMKAATNARAIPVGVGDQVERLIEAGARFVVHIADLPSAIKSM